MRISFNDEALEVEAVTLAEVLSALGLGDAVVATAVNSQFVPASARSEFPVADGDAIEVVAPMQGG